MADGKKKWDGDGVPIEDSNMAGVGGEEDKAARKKAAETEPAWEGVGQEPGLWIWRIESFQVVPWPKEKYGQFHQGDSYILLKAEYKIGEDGKPTEKIERDIHFWLGKKTSVDEKGTAAYKTVELDDFFDGEPVQHREVQGIESELFLSYFDKEIKYLAGGVESGFEVTQQDVFTNRLYQVRRNAKRKIIFEEEAAELKSLNHRDAFIFDTGRTIYVWFGDDSSPFLKQAANAKAETWEQERNGESKVSIEIDDDFWAGLGGKGKITAAADVGAEVEADFGEGALYSVQVDDTTRQLEINQVGNKDLKISMLDSTAVMMLDTRAELFMWIGSQASKAEGRIAMSTAVNYLKMNKRNLDTTAIHVLKEGKGRNNPVWKKTFAD